MNKADENRQTALMRVAYQGNVNMVKLLLEYGADIMIQNVNGDGVMSYAVYQGHLEVLKILYEHLLNTKSVEQVEEFVNMTYASSNHTILHIASFKGHEQIVQYLIDIVKVDRNKIDDQSRTALQVAQEKGHQNIVSLLSNIESE